MLVSYLLPILQKKDFSKDTYLIKLLERTIDSVLLQSTPNWELIIIAHPKALDTAKSILSRIASATNFTQSHKIQILTRTALNAANALNHGLNNASGKFIGALTLGNRIASHCTYEITKIVMGHSKVQLIYPNHDIINLRVKRSKPFFKPSFSPDLLYCQNYFGELIFFDKKLLLKVGGWDENFDLAHHYELALRCVQQLMGQKNSSLLPIRECSPIYHTTHFLSHQASDSLKTSNKRILTAKTTQLQRLNHEERKALQKNIGHRAYIAQIKPRLFRPLWQLPKLKPLVSILIPTHNGLGVLRTCIESITSKTTYPNYEILIIDNRSTDTKTLQYLNYLSKNHPRISIIQYNRAFNYSAINNFAAKKAQGSLLCLLNNDTEVLTPNWLELMVSHALQTQTGCVGAMLYYPDGSIQHAGTIVGLHGAADHAFKGARNNSKSDYFNYLSSIRNPKAVTAATLVIQKTIFEQVGGLDAKKLKVAFNDVDLCLKVLKAGFFNVWLPHVELIHHESKSRKLESIPHIEKLQREEYEHKVLKKRYDLGNYYHTQYD